MPKDLGRAAEEVLASSQLLDYPIFKLPHPKQRPSNTPAPKQHPSDTPAAAQLTLAHRQEGTVHTGLKRAAHINTKISPGTPVALTSHATP